MRILIADSLSQHALEALKRLGVSLEVRADLSAETLPGAIAGFHALVVRSTAVTAETLNAADQLSLIIRAGAGVNTIDVAAASERGVFVTNCPGRNSDAVAELAIGLLIACDRNIVDATVELRGGRWNKKRYSESAGLKGRTLGILGMGMIGQAVARRARGLEMKVAAWSRSLTAEAAEQYGVERAATPLALASRCDAVSLHLAAAKETRGLVDREFLEALPAGAILINTSRGDVIDGAALRAAIAERGLRVGLDVFEDEPPAAVGAFAAAELAQRTTCTPHIGASTDQASAAIAAEVVRIVDVFRVTGRPLNAVNLCQRTPATHSLVVRHFNRVGVLASVLDSLRSENINIEEMDNAVFEGAGAACCTLQLDQPPSADLLAALGGLPHVLQVHLEPR